MVEFGQKWLYSGKVVVFERKLLYSIRSCNRESGCIWVKAVVFGQNWLYSGKKDFIRGKWLYSGTVDVIDKKVVVLGKVIVFLQKWLCSSKNGCVREKVGVFRQSG